MGRNRLGLTHAGKDGYYGQVTSTLDWCEENFMTSDYVAEVWNTFSNSWFLIYGLLGLLSCYLTKSEKRFYLCYLCGMSVGIGSMLFHGTLKYEMQLADELPMIYCASAFAFCLATTFVDNKSEKYIYATILTLYSLLVTVIYLIVKDPIFHQVAYGILVAVLVFLPMIHIHKLSKENSNKESISSLYYIWLSGIVSFAIGFALWNIEHHICDDLRRWRCEIGYPFRAVGELHAWWHFFTAYSTHTNCVLNQYLRQVALKRTDKVHIKYLLLLPMVGMKPIKKTKTKRI